MMNQLFFKFVMPIILSISFPAFAESNDFLVEAGASNPTEQYDILLSLFEKDVHPFLKKNCAECHGEGAIYPKGPEHSANDVTRAFGHFSSRMNGSDLRNTTFWKVGTNGHYCNEHGELCEEMDTTISELKRILINYDTARSSTNFPDAKRDKGFKFVSSDQNHTDFTIKKQFDDTVEGEISARLLPVVAGSNYYRVSDLRILLPPGSYKVSEINLTVNGAPLPNATGFESIETEIFIPDLIFEAVTLSPTELSPSANDQLGIHEAEKYVPRNFDLIFQKLFKAHQGVPLVNSEATLNINPLDILDIDMKVTRLKKSSYENLCRGEGLSFFENNVMRSVFDGVEEVYDRYYEVYEYPFVIQFLLETYFPIDNGEYRLRRFGCDYGGGCDLKTYISEYSIYGGGVISDDDIQKLSQSICKSLASEVNFPPMNIGFSPILSRAIEINEHVENWLEKESIRPEDDPEEYEDAKGDVFRYLMGGRKTFLDDLTNWKERFE